MINLLPYDTKKQLRAAHTNAILIRYIIFIGIAIAFLAGACYLSYFILSTSKTNASQTIATNQSDTSSYDSVRVQATNLQADLLSAKTIFNQQIRYSYIITQLGSVLPSGVVIENLNLDSNKIGTPITLKARARTTSEATDIKTSFQKSTLFSNVNVQSATVDQSDSTGYPVAVNISLTINRGLVR
jgi:Tfp pilus assembly protein PilN